MSPLVYKGYEQYFGCKIGDQDKPWAPHFCCSKCAIGLSKWLNGSRTSMQFAIPMIWREPRDHYTDCYFCLTDIKGITSKTKKNICYPNLQSAIHPVEHSTELEVPKPKKVSFDDDTVEYAMLDQDDEEFIPPPMPLDKTRLPHIINQSELNDLVRDLNLTKDQSELLGSRLKGWNLLDEETKVSFFRTRQSDFSVHFEMQGSLCYCNYVDRVMELLGVQHEPSEWRLSIDSPKYSLKAVLLHKGNVLPSIPIGHSVHMKESHENMDILLKLIRYDSYNWHICGDLKVIGLLLGMQPGYTKYCCFLCEWDSRARQSHYIVKEWPLRHQLTAGTKSVSCQSLVNPEKILLPPLHIKLGLMKTL
ncbi:hypothetical protein LOD99_12042 [Oopsacas minuta]|uniref:Uncharacterized protein n=1 Tax=Oopsacas minuta TaxID=111878 RepID=A0AAV7JHS2_9METZ|nr:hypothetical protein LOD99_12042 [Oopsacas minuta]